MSPRSFLPYRKRKKRNNKLIKNTRLRVKDFKLKPIGLSLSWKIAL
jgi:hypothetical protein